MTGSRTGLSAGSSELQAGGFSSQSNSCFDCLCFDRRGVCGDSALHAEFCSDRSEIDIRMKISDPYQRIGGIAARWFSAIPLWFLKTPSAELIFGRVFVCGDCRFVWQ